MAIVVRSELATTDLADIAEYISADSPAAAHRWLDEVDRTLQLVARFPQIGEQLDHLSPGSRRHCFGCYLLFYRQIEGGIELQRVLHGSRRIEDLI
jgi:toxin ParE1/3/4